MLNPKVFTRCNKPGKIKKPESGVEQEHCARALGETSQRCRQLVALGTH